MMPVLAYVAASIGAIFLALTAVLSVRHVVQRGGRNRREPATADTPPVRLAILSLFMAVGFSAVASAFSIIQLF